MFVGLCVICIVLLDVCMCVECVCAYIGWSVVPACQGASSGGRHTGLTHPSLCAAQGAGTCCSGVRRQSAPRQHCLIAAGVQSGASPSPSARSAGSCHWTSVGEGLNEARAGFQHQGQQDRRKYPSIKNPPNLSVFLLATLAETQKLSVCENTNTMVIKNLPF